MKHFIILIGMVVVFTTNCLAQARTFATAIEDKQMVTISLTKNQLKLEPQKAHSKSSESRIMCKELKDTILSILSKDGFKARLGFVLAETKDTCSFLIKETSEIYSITNPNGNSYFVVLEKKEDKVSITLFCDFKEDWQISFRKAYGFDYMPQ